MVLGICVYIYKDPIDMLHYRAGFRMQLVTSMSRQTQARLVMPQSESGTMTITSSHK